MQTKRGHLLLKVNNKLKVTKNNTSVLTFLKGKELESKLKAVTAKKVILIHT